VLEAWPAVLYIGTGLLGLIAGSFLNVVAYRLPLMMERAWREQCAELAAEQGTPGQAASTAATAALPALSPNKRFDLAWPPSACPSCNAPVKPQHNIPVLSYLLLRGRCASCGVAISRRYPIVEAVAAL